MDDQQKENLFESALYFYNCIMGHDDEVGQSIYAFLNKVSELKRNDLLEEWQYFSDYKEPKWINIKLH